MPLTDEQKQAIRDEEFFRAEVRREISSASGPSPPLTRLAAFFDTKAGFWLLTTVLAGVVATAMTSLQRYVDREAIARRERVERALRDAETMLKLAPMLTSEKPSETKIAAVLLTGLASDDAVDGRIATQVRALLDDALNAGARPDATPEEQAVSEAIASYADKARIEVIQGTEGQSPAAAPTVAAFTLPTRVYIQIADQTDRSLAERARDALRATGLVVPGIEVVGPRRTPQQDTIRYCADKVGPEVLDRIKAAAAALEPPVPAITPLAPALCGDVRPNHFELWFARRPD